MPKVKREGDEFVLEYGHRENRDEKITRKKFASLKRHSEIKNLEKLAKIAANRAIAAEKEGDEKTRKRAEKSIKNIKRELDKI